MTEVVFTALPHDPVAVARFTALAAQVARANRNRTWSSTIELVTDDIREAYSRLDPALENEIEHGRFRGFCWWNDVLDRSILWLRPQVDAAAAVATLAHETAHVFARPGHGRTWRRMYALLLPLAVRVVDDREPGWWEIESRLRTVVSRYHHHRDAVARLVEEARLLRAARASYDRWCGGPCDPSNVCDIVPATWYSAGSVPVVFRAAAK